MVPHMGWSAVDAAPGTTLFAGIEQEYFYFVHSYAASVPVAVSGSGAPDPFVSTAHHGQTFVAAIEDGVLAGTQFHPEKSGDAGAILIENWLASW